MTLYYKRNRFWEWSSSTFGRRLNSALVCWNWKSERNCCNCSWPHKLRKWTLCPKHSSRGTGQWVFCLRSQSLRIYTPNHKSMNLWRVFFWWLWRGAHLNKQETPRRKIVWGRFLAWWSCGWKLRWKLRMKIPSWGSGMCLLANWRFKSIWLCGDKSKRVLFKSSFQQFEAEK